MTAVAKSKKQSFHQIPDYEENALLPVTAVADALNCSLTTVWKLAASGTLGQPLKLAGKTYWRWHQVAAYIAKCEAASEHS